MSAVPEFECRKCGTIVSREQYEADRFCPHCGTFLRIKKVRIDSLRRGAKRSEPMEIKRDDVNVNSLFYKYLQYSPIGVGGGLVFETVNSWIFAKKSSKIAQKAFFV